MYKLLRWGSGRMLAFSVIVISLLLCLYYVSQTQQAPSTGAGSAAALLGPEGPRYDGTGGGSSPGAAKLTTILAQYNEPPADVGMATDTCPLIIPRTADINAQEQFKEFDFEPSWVRSREYWDDSFEARYVELRKDPTRPPLKVILMPHSHTDPGWLKTFEQYYHSSTRGILNNMVTKLQQWSNMTFIWSEVSFLSMWWESAHPTKKMVVKRLVKEGRLEMTTGGWVMTDEASSHIYAMLDQLIEGHQWLKTNLDVTPEYGWAVDPFGHGGTVPYLLKKSGASGTIIQRIHYAWKQWFAKKQCGDFVWLQPWDKSGASDMLTHNQPFDIYNIKHSCGPHPHVCLNFDFRKIRGEYTEYSVRAVDITSNNVKQMAELLLEQFSRTGSLFTHNVVLMPLGDDFRYDHPIEWDQQYTNYKILVDYINSHKDEYNAEIVFGTPKDYFREIENRVEKFPTLKGDFFVYSDIFSEGRPAYWSGYFTTRPYMKILDRELEASLRSAEILYTIALNVAKRSGNDIKLYETHFEKLVKARRNLGLFQHHDAITGTSKSFVMKDYAQKLFESIVDMTSLQSFAVQTLTATTNNKPNTVYVLPESDRDSYEKLPKKIPIMVTNQETRKILLFNPLAQARQEIVRLKVTTYKVRILDPQKNPIPYQITPVMNATSITHDVYVVLFVADLKPLAIATYHIEQIERIPMDAISTVHCNGCGKDTVFPIKAMLLGDIQLENKRMKLVFDGQTGFLKRVTKKSTGKIMQCAIQFAAYASAQFHSGAYLFMPDPTQRETDKDILDGSGSRPKIYIVSGRLSARLTVEYGKLLSHHVSIYLQEGGLAEAIYVRNVIDFETPPKNRETEMFMRLQTDISNGEPAVFYTDLNGHQMIKRTKVESIGIEGNYFPITSMAYIEDDSHRLTLLVNHGQGAASYQPGWLEVMLDRRTLYDDSRGMGEGLLDNRRTVMKHWILLEDANGPAPDDDYSKPSLFANHLSNALNYPVNIFVVDATEDEVTLSPETKLITQSFPCDLHLMNLRTNHDEKLPDFPINSALMVLHRQGYSCSVGANPSMEHCPLSDRLHPATSFFKLDRLNVTKTSLTGTKHKEYLKKGLREIVIQPMEIETYNVQFLH